ncbi:MAG TPA: VTC domain-containing protein, partial [Gemmatimonadaceae bacterium]|nr:VTC domain-containing protein [Gemmatimonadaceae bacterium]
MPSTAPGAPEAQGGKGTGPHHTMNRFEVKYLVPTQRVPEIMAEFAPYTRPDPHSPEWGYSISSVYWDTPDFALFWEKI